MALPQVSRGPQFAGVGKGILLKIIASRVIVPRRLKALSREEEEGVVHVQPRQTLKLLVNTNINVPGEGGRCSTPSNFETPCEH